MLYVSQLSKEVQEKIAASIQKTVTETGEYSPEEVEQAVNDALDSKLDVVTHVLNDEFLRELSL